MQYTGLYHVIVVWPARHWIVERGFLGPLQWYGRYISAYTKLGDATTRADKITRESWSVCRAYVYDDTRVPVYAGLQQYFPLREAAAKRQRRIA